VPGLADCSHRMLTLLYMQMMIGMSHNKVFPHMLVFLAVDEMGLSG